MRKLILFFCTLLMPLVMNAKVFKVNVPQDSEDLPNRNFASSYVNVDLNETTGVLTLSYLGNEGNMEVTISQNGVTIENDVIAVSNGQSVIYNLSGYAIGEYLLTIETADGAITQYIIYVEDD